MAATWYYLQLPTVASSKERVMTGKTRNELSRDVPETYRWELALRILRTVIVRQASRNTPTPIKC